MIDTILHIDSFLLAFVSQYGAWTYFVLFLIIFCETGLVLLPFLPGDSLLFASGSIAAQQHASLNVVLLFMLLLAASIMGNQLNYAIGNLLSLKLFSKEKFRFINKQHLTKTQVFYNRHGGKTIILARFIPILRSFAPFVAGLAYMKQTQFFLYNLIGALLWIGSLFFLGYFVGNLPFFKQHFTLLIYGIVMVSLLPALLALFYKQKK